MNKDSKKIAILLLVHKNFNQVKRLIEKLSHEDIYVFVHVDSKTSFSVADNALLKSLPHTYVSETRISTELDKWSLCEASLILARLAKTTAEKEDIYFSYYFNMSGQDYFIKSVDFIVNSLKNDYPKCHIDCILSDNANWICNKFDHTTAENRVIRFFNTHMKRGYVRSAFKLPFKILFVIIKKVTNHHKQFTKLGCTLYGGSAWWILNDNAMGFILDFDKNNDKIMKLYRETETPEETFFQTIIMRSPFSKDVEVNPFDKGQSINMTYVNFIGEGKPFTGHPYIIDKNDFDWLMKLPHFVARKFDETIDSEILDMIDNRLQNN